MMKTLVLAGGSDQIALIHELKRRGHYVILVDYLSNPPARNYADKFIQASTLDLSIVESIAVEEQVNFVTTACTDQALLTMAYVSERLNLPCYLSYQTALNVTNKEYMKRLFIENNIPTAPYIVIDQNSLHTPVNLQYPIVVKPVDCNSSKGVAKVYRKAELVKYINNALQLSKSGKVIIEEYKHGREISVDCFVEDGDVKLLSATQSLKMRDTESFTIVGSDYPAIDISEENRLLDIAKRITLAFQLDNCPLIIQTVINETGIYVLEFSARMGGGSKYRLIQALSGIDIMSKYVEAILGNRPKVYPIRQLKRCRMMYIYCYPGIYDHIEGLIELEKEGTIVDFFLYKTPGMEIINAKTSSDRIAGYYVTAKTEKELIEKLQRADSEIHVISAGGFDMMRHQLMSL